MRCTGHHLIGPKNLILDEATDQMTGGTEMRRGFGHRGAIRHASPRVPRTRRSKLTRCESTSFPDLCASPLRSMRMVVLAPKARSVGASWALGDDVATAARWPLSRRSKYPLTPRYRQGRPSSSSRCIPRWTISDLAAGECAVQDRAKQFPGLAIKPFHLHLLNWREVDGASIDRDPGQQHSKPEIMEVRCLPHHVIAC